MAQVQSTRCQRDGISADIAFVPGESAMTMVTANDERTALLVRNQSESECGIYVEAGDGLRSAIGGLLVQVPAGQMRALVLESMRFKHLSGQHKGCICLRLCDPQNAENPFGGSTSALQLAQLQL